MAKILALALCLHAALVCAAPPPTPILAIEDLGEPVHIREFVLRFVTPTPAGGYLAWGAHESFGKFALVAVHLESGEISWFDTTRFGTRHIQMAPGKNGNVYAFTGVPGHFLKYDAAKGELVDLGAPAPKSSYWAGSAVAPDGHFYIGTYPETELVRCDLATDKIENLGRVSTDPRQRYILHPAASDDGLIFCPVGQHHSEVWAVDPSHGSRQQILPLELTKSQGAPEIWTATDGQVYGRIGTTTFRCRRDSIEPGSTKPRRYRPEQMDAGPLRVGSIDAQGRLTLKNLKSGETKSLQTTYPGSARTIFSVSCERDGRIYGGTVSPAHTFSYDRSSGQLTDHGQLSSGPVQVYDTLNQPRGLFISSYMNASVDFFDPAQPLRKATNPARVVTLAGHERPMQLVQGPDGLLYTGTVPAKGRLGGVLLRVNPNDLTHRTFENVIPAQSLLRLVAVPETGELCGVTSVGGGSSAIPTEKEACLFLWDCKTERVTFRTAPFAGATSYGALVRARNGLIYGVSANRYYAFDPHKREVVFTGKLPVKSLHFPDLNDEPIGDRGLIYGLGDDALFAIDPADHTATIVARAPAFATAYGFYITQDQELFFGSGPRLMHGKLPQE